MEVKKKKLIKSTGINLQRKRQKKNFENESQAQMVNGGPDEIGGG